MFDVLFGLADEKIAFGVLVLDGQHLSVKRVCVIVFLYLGLKSMLKL
jgi:hypothetical protein